MRIPRRRWFDWHSLLGLTAGLMLFVISWSGTTAVFSYEIDWLLNPDLRAETLVGPLDWQGIEESAQATYPRADVQWIEAPRHDGFAAMVVADLEPGVSHRIYVDPVSHEVLGDTSYLNVQRFFRSFHMALFQAEFFSVFGMPVGYFVVLLFAFPLAGLLVTSLAFYKRWWRGLFKLETRRGRKVLFSDLHKLTGLWSLPFTAVIVLTSFWYAAEWFIPRAEFERAGVTASSPLEEPLRLGEAIVLAEKALPSLDIKGAYLPGEGSSVLMVQGHDGGVLTRGRARVEIDLETGAVLTTTPSSSLGPVGRLKETVDVLHFGLWGGFGSQVLYVLFGLALSSLSLTGTYLYAKRRLGTGVAGRREILLAFGATTSLLAMAAAAGWVEIMGYGLAGAAPKVAPAAVWFLAIWCFITMAVLTVLIVALAQVRSATVAHAPRLATQTGSSSTYNRADRELQASQAE